MRSRVLEMGEYGVYSPLEGDSSVVSFDRVNRCCWWGGICIAGLLGDVPRTKLPAKASGGGKFAGKPTAGAAVRGGEGLNLSIPGRAWNSDGISGEDGPELFGDFFGRALASTWSHFLAASVLCD